MGDHRVEGPGSDGTDRGNIQSLALGDGNRLPALRGEGNGGLSDAELHVGSRILRKLKLGALHPGNLGARPDEERR